MKKSEFNNDYMQEAIKQAEIALLSNEIPVGAVIVEHKSGKIVSKAHNLMQQKNNPTFHAEIVAINSACDILGSKNLSNCDIYVSLEPCAMCAAAISYARLRRLFYSASDPKQGAVENGVRFFTSTSCFHCPEIYLGLMSEISLQLMKSFFSKIRKDSL